MQGSQLGIQPQITFASEVEQATKVVNELSGRLLGLMGRLAGGPPASAGSVPKPVPVPEGLLDDVKQNAQQIIADVQTMHEALNRLENKLG